jgi:penicillin amidase
LKGARLRALFFEFEITEPEIMKSTFVVLIALFLGACAATGSRDSTPGESQGQDLDQTQAVNQPGLVRLVRDNYGVPHIYSDSVFGLYYGYGYAVAQDRLFQMEMARRSTQGLVAAALGVEYVGFDRNARQIFSPSSIQKQLDALQGADREIFDGFAAGFNAWLKQIHEDPGNLMPKQFVDFGFEPVEWTAYDVAMIFVGTMANRFGDFNTELDNVQILQSLAAQHGEQAGADIFNLLNPRYTNNAPTTIPAEDWSTPVPDVLAGGPESQSSANYRQAALHRIDAFTGPVISGISNCFVLGRDKVSGANAILVNGPQFGWFTPSYVYSVGMHGAGIDVVGNTPFAYPMVMFGHNASITWGSTWGAGDIVDIFAEQLNPEDFTQYHYQGSYRSFEHRTEIIEVRDGEAVAFDVYRSVHGPVTLIDQDAGVAYARHRSWEGREIEQLLSWVHATWVSDFETWKAEAEKSSINVNMYFADTRGNVGYFYGGHYPQRARGHDNRFPVTGDGSMDWQGRLPIEVANPHVFNPSSGFVANWNNKPGQGVMNSDQFWYSWSEADRIDYFNTALAARARFTPDEAWRLITTSSHAPYLLPLIDSAAASGEEGDPGAGDYAIGNIRKANEILQSWDLQSRDLDRDGYYDGAPTAIFRTFAGQLIETVLADDLGKVFPPFAATGYPEPDAPTGAGTNIQTGMKAVIESLGGRGEYDLLNGRSANEVVTRALHDTLAALRNKLGEDMSAWRLPVAERPFGTSNFLGIPQTFNDELMIQHIEQNRGTENNMVIMNEDRIIGYEVTPPGQNAFISPAGSKGKHFDDQFDLYSDFGRKRMWFYQADVEANKQSETVLSY